VYRVASLMEMEFLRRNVFNSQKPCTYKYIKARKHTVSLTVKDIKGSNAKMIFGYVAVKKISEFIKTDNIKKNILN
jgi:PKD repeat protein